MSVEVTSSLNNNASQIPVSSEVFDYLKILFDNLAFTHKDAELKNALHFLGSGEFAENVADVIKALVSAAPHFIKFPVEDELLQVQQEFYDLSQTGNAEYGFPNVIGVIDCVQIGFQPVDEENMEIYLDHNSEYSINAQLVCGPDLQIYNVLAAFPGKFQNLSIWRNSKLCEQLKQSNNACWLIGNAKYYQEPNLMTPILSPETEADQLYNHTHNAVYKRIKYCIQMLKTRFKCLSSVLSFNPDNVCAIIIACCVLHNICVCHNDLIEIDTNEIESSLEEEEQIVCEATAELTENYNASDENNK